VNVRTYDYAELVAESTSITLHVTSVVLFGLLFFYTWSGSLSGVVVLGLGSTLSLIGYAIWRTVLQLDQEHPDSSGAPRLCLRPGRGGWRADRVAAAPGSLVSGQSSARPRRRGCSSPRSWACPQS